MAPFSSLAILLLLAGDSYYAAADPPLFPFLPPFSGNICSQNVCGRGTCVASNTTILGFSCRCHPGWIQVIEDGPCVIPNCTLNINCSNSPAPAPAQVNHSKPNSSIFDPCSWADCGSGRCNKTSLFTHTCECDVGFYNLLNSSAFPCYRECSFGAGCENLGFNITNSSNRNRPPPTSPVSNSLRQEPRSLFVWLFTWMSSLALHHLTLRA